MKKIISSFIVIIMIFLLGGCTSKTDRILNNSKISQNQDYSMYKEYSEKKLLDENGYYSEKDKSEPNMQTQNNPNPSGKPIRVTFAQNAYIEIEYFTDKKKTQKIDTASYYVSPGDTIYVSVKKSKSPYSNMYDFSEIILQEYLVNGKKGDFRKSFPKGKDLSVTIPKDFDGSELSVIPYGKYYGRPITLNAFYYQDNKVKTLLNEVEWQINKVKYKNGKNEISKSAEDYTVVCDYSAYKDSFYFVESTPTAFNHDTKKNIIEFNSKTPNESNLNYEIQFHPYLTASIQINGNPISKFADKWIDKIKKEESIKSIKINKTEENVKTVLKNKFEKIKCGDLISITLSDKYSLECKTIKSITKVPVENGYTEYSITVPDNITKEIVFEVNKKEADKK